MNYEFTDSAIREQVLALMRELGIYPAFERDTLLKLDGRIHRYTIEGDKPSKKDGAYQIHSDGRPAGWVQNWKIKDGKVNWKFDLGNEEELENNFYSPEHMKEWEEKQKKRDEELLKKQQEAAELARTQFEQLPEADNNHPYLSKNK